MEKHLLHNVINPDFPRPDAAVVKRLAAHDTAKVADRRLEKAKGHVRELEQHIEKIAAICQDAEYPRGTTIFSERGEARQIYEQAKAAGHVASLLDQERPNIFTQSVANIMPGESVKITISYVERLKYEDGSFEFVFPMVVGPRFNPPGCSDGVGAVARGRPGISGQETEVQYLKPNERSGHDISLAVELDAFLARWQTLRMATRPGRGRATPSVSAPQAKNASPRAAHPSGSASGTASPSGSRSPSASASPTGPRRPSRTTPSASCRSRSTITTNA